MRIAVYPGSFDPVTLGHLDIIRRASGLYDMLIVAVALNGAKTPLFTLDERINMLRDSCEELDKIEIESFEGLLADFCKRRGVSVIIRGLRATADFEYEQAAALMNKKLAPEVETLFLAASADFSFVSSSLIKEVFSHGGDISAFIPVNVIPHLNRKFSF